MGAEVFSYAPIIIPIFVSIGNAPSTKFTYSEIDMKVLLRYLVFVPLFYACVSNTDENQTREPATLEAPTEYALTRAERLEDYLFALDSTDITSVGKATERYFELFEETDSLQNDSGVVLILEYMEMMTMNAHKSVFQEGVDYSPLVRIEATETNSDIPEELQEAYMKIHENGFRVRETEGMFVLELNPFFVQETFYPYVSPTLEIYLQQLGKENLEGFAEDAALAIPYESLVQRVIWWEEFLHNTRGTAVEPLAKEQYDKYFICLTIGMDNTPAIESEQLSPYFQQAYTYLKDFAPDSDTYKQLESYISLLQDRQLDEAKGLLPGLIPQEI